MFSRTPLPLPVAGISPLNTDEPVQRRVSGDWRQRGLREPVRANARVRQERIVVFPPAAQRAAEAGMDGPHSQQHRVRKGGTLSVQRLAEGGAQPFANPFPDALHGTDYTFSRNPHRSGSWVPAHSARLSAGRLVLV